MASRGGQCEIQILHIRPKATETKFGLKNLADGGYVYALVVEKRYNGQNVLEKTALQVNSPHLLKVFKSTIEYYPSIPADYSVPFQMLYHYWDKLHAALDDDDLEDEPRMHLKLLLGFMKAEIGPSKEQVETMLKARPIAFSTLWTIFRPGRLVFTVLDSHPWLLRLEKTAYEENKKQGKYLEVHCTYTGYDGRAFGQAKQIFGIYQKKQFAAENPCKINQLPVMPLDWVEGREIIQERLAERGTRFLAIQGIQVKAYHGIARHLEEPPYDFYHPSMAEFEGVWLPHTEGGRVVLDERTFREENYSEGVSVSPTSVDDRSERMLCPPFSYGYSLSRKEWCKLYIDSLSSVDWNKSALDDLVMQEDRKTLLEALTFSHVFPDNVRDQMKQKGKGLVVLLHGSPGSGKTLTAECVAEATGKALVTATMGDLNQENVPGIFEVRLKRLLQFATIWKAVVLLDEADVFLEGRSETAGEGTSHNALVAVFLKYLEYFSGIVFLTSNRAIVFDKAMKSRIHLALEYKAPDHNMRRLMWKHRLSAIPADELDLNIEEDVEKFITEDVNGREIANCVGTARTLARHKGVKLALEHIHIVLETRREFEKCLDGMRLKRHQTDPEPFKLARRNTLESNDD
ncbi:P-loop containing nucleoside triphosphate hydrolase protein [Hypoxylon trugodes]|uniref:P-loop containing nucleoside triphosphate hydrolase protein n=1 Tax=Hypoxylon trugodes TaxID=326681 RepID=UPI00219BB21B|nr:P-loop containing nucleoside triphosphate hydrolase protein [Hypoxylon trugodes]KAI1383099.1 P-loop containing nucleoside triphosphate hydrolase protein [Hypoxylon trugodes]